MKAVSSPKSWKSLLEDNDATTLWQSLHRLVSIHPLVRSAQRHQNNSKSITTAMSLPDLTQDLYLQLLEKARFIHYVEGGMSDAEIEREIFQVELTNMLIGRLRRRQPENYRIVRRIGAVLESEPRFRVMRRSQKHPSPRYRQAVNVVYGLREWGDEKPIKDVATLEELIASVPMRVRNRRRAGCTGDTQVIISSPELIELLVEIFTAIDSPLPLRSLRTLTLLKLPLCDAIVSSMDQLSESNEGRAVWDRMLISTQFCPEKINLQIEEERFARRAAHDFLASLDQLARFQSQRTEKLWRILWHYYFDPTEPSQTAIADMLGMSDSSVSEYRRRLEQEMQKLLKPVLSPEQFSYFAEELAGQLKKRLARANESRKRRLTESSEIPSWTSFTYSSFLSLEGLPAV